MDYLEISNLSQHSLQYLKTMFTNSGHKNNLPLKMRLLFLSFGILPFIMTVYFIGHLLVFIIGSVTTNLS